MGLASALLACGCRQTRLMGSEPSIWIEWVRCPEHYDPAIDDTMVIEAAKNKREYEKAITGDPGILERTMKDV
jgi:hypothetical protein